MGALHPLELNIVGLRAEEVSDIGTANLEGGSNGSIEDGAGMLVCLDGSVYRGQWKDGKR